MVDVFLKDKQTGDEFAVKDHDAGQYLGTGNFLLSDDSAIPMQNTKTKEIEWLKGSAAVKAANESGDYQYADRTAVLNQKYGGLKQGMIAALEGGADMLAIGGGQSVEEGLGVKREDIEGRSEVHPIARTVGAGAALVGETLATGGLADLAPLSLVGRAGRLASEAVIPEAGAGIAGVASRLGRLAVRGGTEGSILGGVQEANRELLEDKPLNGERIAAAALETGGLGAVLGAGLGATGEALTSLHEKAVELVPKVLNEEKIAKSLFEGRVGTLQKDLAETAKAEMGITSDVDLIKKAQEKLNNLDIPVNANEPTPKILENIRTKLSDTAAQNQSDINTVVKMVDDDASGIVDIKKIQGKLKSEVIDKITPEDLKLPGVKAQFDRLNKALEPVFQPEAQYNFQHFNAVLNDLDSLATKGRELPGGIKVPIQEYLVKPINIMREEYNSQLYNTIKTTYGDEAASSFMNLRHDAAMNDFLLKNLDNTVEKMATRSGGMDYGQVFKDAIKHKLINVAARTVGGAAIGGLIGGEHGAEVGAGLGNLALITDVAPSLFRPLTNKVAGNFYQTALKLSKAGDVISKKNIAAVGNFFRNAEPGTIKLASDAAGINLSNHTEEPDSRFNRYNAAVDQLNNISSDPGGATGDATVRHALGPDAYSMRPVMAQSLKDTSSRAVAFLQQKVPTRERDTDMFLSQVKTNKKTQSVSDQDMAKFLRYYEAVKSPKKILSDFSKGVMSSEQAEVLRNVYPGLHSEVSDTIANEMLNNKKFKPTREHLVQLSILMDKPYASYMTPAFIAASQAAFAEQGQGEGQDQGQQATLSPSLRKPLNLAKDMEL